MRLLTHLLLLCCVVTFTATPLAAGPPTEALMRIQQLQDTLASVAEQVGPSVVAIRAYRHLVDPNATSEDASMSDRSSPISGPLIPAVGSGVIIDESGLILTNEHVVRLASPHNIECLLSNGQRYRVQGMTSDPRSDLAVLRIDADNLPTAELGDIADVRQGHFAIVLGNPFGTSFEARGKPAMSFGVISSLDQDLTNKLDPNRYYGNLIQTDARINPGNSGGPLLNLEGRVIGINTAVSTRSGSSDGVGYAVPISRHTKGLIEQLCRGERIRYAYLGVRVNTAPHVDNDGILTGGAEILHVDEHTPAWAAHLKEGDIIVGFDGERVRSADELIQLVGRATVGEEVPIRIVRDEKRVKFFVRPTERPTPLKAMHFEPAFAWRGMRLEDLDQQLRNKFNLPDGPTGLVVTHVQANSPAARAGIEPGQLIAQIGGQIVKGVRHLRHIAPQLDGPLLLVIGSPREKEVTLP